MAALDISNKQRIISSFVHKVRSTRLPPEHINTKMSKDLNDHVPVPDYSKAGAYWVQAAFYRDNLQKRFDRAQEDNAKKMELEVRRRQFVKDAQEKRDEARQRRGEEAQMQTGKVKVEMEDQSEILPPSSSADRRNGQHRGLKRRRGEGVRNAATPLTLEEIPRRIALSAYPPYTGPEAATASTAESDLAALLRQQSAPSAPRMNGKASSHRPQQHGPQDSHENYYTAIRSTAQQQPQATTTKPAAKLPQQSANDRTILQPPNLAPFTRRPTPKGRGEGR
ncbi:hypothetical protein BST61_g8731 [Cercospora zeina]